MPKHRLRALAILFPCFFVLAAWTFYVQSDPFFWDTIQLASKHAHHFFNNNLRWTPLPTEIDSGHPPVFGYLLAFVWTIAGKTLEASHWTMFPFLCGIAWLLYRLACKTAGPKWAFWLVPLAFFDPVLAGQSALVSPDIVLVFCFLLATNGLLDGRNIWVALGIFGLCAISMRGMMTATALLLWPIISPGQPRLLFRPKRFLFLAFLPGFAFAAWFLWWHHQTSGWIAYHPGSPWAPAFEPATGTALFRNLLVTGWRWTDFGRIFEWGVLAFLLASPYSGVRTAIMGLFRNANQKPANSNGATTLLLFLCLAIFLTPSAIIYKTLSAHRYFLPLFLTFHWLVFQEIVGSGLTEKYKKSLLILLLAGMLSGNCWIYPRGISMDWDSTLAHLPYHRLRSEMIDFIEKEKIPFQNVGTAFPNINTGENLLLNGDERQFAEKNFSRNEYMLASNIFNDFSEEDYKILDREWQPLKTVIRGGVWMKLYKRPE